MTAPGGPSLKTQPHEALAGVGAGRTQPKHISSCINHSHPSVILTILPFHASLIWQTVSLVRIKVEFSRTGDRCAEHLAHFTLTMTFYDWKDQKGNRQRIRIYHA